MMTTPVATVLGKEQVPEPAQHVPKVVIMTSPPDAAPAPTPKPLAGIFTTLENVARIPTPGQDRVTAVREELKPVVAESRRIVAEVRALRKEMDPVLARMSSLDWPVLERAYGQPLHPLRMDAESLSVMLNNGSGGELARVPSDVERLSITGIEGWAHNEIRRVVDGSRGIPITARRDYKALLARLAFVEAEIAQRQSDGLVIPDAVELPDMKGTPPRIPGEQQRPWSPFAEENPRG